MIIGARGYIGTRLSTLAEHSGIEVQAVTRRPNDHENDLDGLLTRLQHVGQPITIVWLLAGPRHNEEHQLRRLLAASPDNTRLVYASSCAVYGQTDHAASEDAPLAPQDDYATAKASYEALVAASRLRASVLRLATVHGHPAAGAPRQSVHQLVRQAATGTITLYGADNWRPFLSLDAAARALLRAALDITLSGTFNVAQEHATFGAIARQAAELLNARIIPDERTDRRSYRVDTTRARAVGLLHDDGDSLADSMRAYAAKLAGAYRGRGRPRRTSSPRTRPQTVTGERQPIRRSHPAQPQHP